MLISRSLPRPGRRSLRALLGGRRVFSLGGVGCGCCGSGGVCPVTFHVTTCAGAAVVAAPVVLSPDGGATTFTVNTDGGGTAIFFLPTAQLGPSSSWLVTISTASTVIYKRTEPLSCNQVITVKLLPAGSPAATWHVGGCCGSALPGATLSIAGATYTSDSSGNIAIGLTDPGSYPWTLSKARFVSSTGTLTIPAACATGTTYNVTLNPAAGFACGPPLSQPDGNPRPDPIPTTLSFTDSVYGSTTLAYNGTSTWLGSIVVSYPGSCLCEARTVTIHYALSGVGPSECPTPSDAHTLNGQYSTCNLTISGIPETKGCPSDTGYTDPARSLSCVPGTSASVGGVMAIPDGLPFQASVTFSGPGAGACTGALLYPTGATFTATE